MHMQRTKFSAFLRSVYLAQFQLLYLKLLVHDSSNDLFSFSCHKNADLCG